jgi:hypothetical protein
MNYYETPNGVAFLDGDAAGAPLEGWKVISKKQYEAKLAKVEEARGARRAEVLATADETRREDFDALVAAGIPERVAARLSRHKPEGKS